MEGCHTGVPRRLRRGRDVQTAADPVAVDARQISTASETVVSWKIHIKSECVTTVVPKLAAASKADEVVQPRPPEYGYTDSLPLGIGCLESPRIDAPEASPPAEFKISRSPDRLQTEISATEMAGGSPLAYVDICVIPDVLPITMSVKTVMSDKSMMMDTPDGVVNRMEIAGGSPPPEIRISKSLDRLQTEPDEVRMSAVMLA